MINKKIKAIAELIEEPGVIDIGTDHGYLIRELARLNKLSRAIAADINTLPLDSAKKNLKNIPNIDFIKSDGLQSIDLDILKDYKAIVIAGMGGSVIKSILESSNEKISNQTLYLQPSGSIFILRNYLYEMNYQIYQEKIIFDNDQYYEIIVCRKSESKVNYTNNEIMFGPINLNEKSELFINYLKNSKEYYQVLLKSIPRSNNNYAKFTDKINKIDEILKDEK